MGCHEDMNRSTLTMAENPFTLHRSQSTPDFFSPPPRSNPHASNNRSSTEKSLPSLPLDIDFDDTEFNASSLSFQVDIAQDQAQNTKASKKKKKKKDKNRSVVSLITQTQAPQLELYPSQTRRIEPQEADEKEKEKEKDRKKTGRGRTFGERPRTWMGFRSTPDVRETLREDVRPISRQEYYKVKDAATQREPIDRDRSWSVSGSFPSFTRKSRPSTSRSPSPPRRRQTFNDEPMVSGTPTLAPTGSIPSSPITSSPATSSPAATPTTTPSKRVDTATTTTTTASNTKKPSRASTFFLKRPQVFVRSSSLDVDDSDSYTSSSGSLTQTTVDSQTSQPSSSSDGGGDTSASDYTSNSSNGGDMTPASAPEPPPPTRDPLWRPFKTLDTQFSKLQACKTTNTRMAVVRQLLLPFLQEYVHHDSNRRLPAVHLETRAAVLDKWWGALLDMLDGRSTGHIAGVDRPRLLETISMIMMRPEWRQSASFFLPLAERCPSERVKTPRARSWTSGSDGTEDAASFDSSASSGSEFLTESAFHNVRNMFTANLVKQMVIVVDKVSMRNTPASLINFAGKACAYAFVFAPGVADALVRLWSLSADLIRRVADGFNLPRRSSGESDDMVALFPLNLQSLGWTSVKGLSDTLRREPRLPMQVGKVNWHGPWMPKWQGRETDLFYIFCKYFYLLSSEFMPAGLPLVEKTRAPAFVPIHAQMLGLLDSTLHRQAAFDAMMGPPFGDSAHGSDASLTDLATPFGANHNLFKGMGENRMVMLLRDFLADHSATGAEPRQTFAEAFMALVTAATKRTSQYNHNACFTLCDLLEEVLTAYSTVETNEYDTAGLIDWPFWIDVCRRVMANHNTMSEMRILSFVFSMWDVISATPGLKEMVCRDWLLDEDVFGSLFTHWSPMVRAYFMRLLCWRICRDSGRADETDTRIFLLVSTRLKKVWSHYLWLKQKAELEGKYPPSSAPCYPSPGKKFMIIRTDMPPSPLPGATAPTGFDSFSNPLTMPGSGGAAASGTSLEHSARSSSLPDNSAMGQGLPTGGKKRWSLLSRVLTLSNNIPNSSPPPRSTSSSTMDEDLDQVRREMNRSPSTGPPPPPPKLPYATPFGELGSSSPPSASSPSSSASSSPVISDNSTDRPSYIFRFVLSWCPPNTMSPRERMLYTPRLPSPAQSRVTSQLFPVSSTMPAAGKPMPTRTYSGLAITGLVAEARNANPSASVDDTSSSRQSFATSRNSSVESFQHYFHHGERPNAPSQDDVPRKPVGFEGMTQAKYSGKALVEWAIAVMECNGFVERRRDEGVLGLAEVEVPVLGVEGFRRSS